MMSSNKKEGLEQTEVPDVEWWDSVILGDAGYDTLPESGGAFESAEITQLVQHPITFEPPGAKEATPLPVYLTKKERCDAVGVDWFTARP